jgi:hypothetical protein
MRGARFATVAKVIETPKLIETKTDRRMLNRLRAYGRLAERSAR